MGDRVTFQELLSEYSDWVDKDIPLSIDWLEEIEYLVFLRGQIHDETQKSGDYDRSALQTTDKTWQAWALAHSSPDFLLESSKDNVPKTQWWWWIDRLDELTPEERSTI